MGEGKKVIMFWCILKVESEDMTRDQIWIRTGVRGGGGGEEEVRITIKVLA